MKRHDHVIAAIDMVAETLKILVRTDYANERQMARNLDGAIAALSFAAGSLADAKKTEN